MFEDTARCSGCGYLFTDGVCRTTGCRYQERRIVLQAFEDDYYQPCWKCGEPLTPENAPSVDGGIQCESCLTVWAIPGAAA